MGFLQTPEARLALSLALGLLFGAERERRMRERGYSDIAGLRTFGLIGLLGGLLSYSEIPYVVLGGIMLVGALVLVGYALDPDRHKDKGLTTEVALLVTYTLGAVALTRPVVAGTAAIVATLLLHLRGSLHHFVRDALRDEEMQDGLLLLVFAFVVLPLTPDVDLGPYHALNPHRLARLMFVITLISSAGYVAQRAFGVRYGLVVSGLTSGFVSSTATIAALGLRARQDASRARSAAAGALASSVATIVQYLLVIATVDASLLGPLALPLGLALAASIGVSLVFTRSLMGTETADPPRGRAFQLLPALAAGGGSALVALAAAALGDRIGESGIVLVSSISGFVDAHATAASVGTLHHGGQLEASVAVLALLGALTTNTISKIAMAVISGPRSYWLHVAWGVLVIALASWLGWLLGA